MPRLYKYRSLASDEDFARAQSFIRDGWAWFPTADAVNDPLEFKCCLDFTSDQSVIVAMIAEELRIAHSISDADAASQAADLVANLRPAKRREIGMKLALELWQRMAQGVSIFWLAGVPDDILMWSFYADRHRGICIELNHESLDLRARPVDYNNRLAPITIADLTSSGVAPSRVIDTFDLLSLPAYSVEPDGFIDKLFFRKAACWSYEHEYRIVLPSMGSCLVRLPSQAIKRLIIGFAMPAGQKKRLVNWLRATTPNVQIAYTLPGLYESHGLKVFDEDDLPRP